MVTEAPYAFEKLIDSYDSIGDSAIKLALLSSTVKLFFMRPPEVQRMLGRLLAKATEDVSSQDLHDRALLYYRLLKSGADPATIKGVVKTHTLVASSAVFSEDDDSDLRVQLMKEFNTLSIIYGKPSVNFIAPVYQANYKKQPDNHPLAEGADAYAPELSVQQVVEQPSPALMGGEEADLLGFGASPASSPRQAAFAPAPSAGLSLSPSATITGDTYQSTWASIPDNEATVSAVPLTRLPSNTDEVETKLAASNMMTMASGELPNEFKFFLYAQDMTLTNTYLVQANVEKTADPLLILTVKATGSADVAPVIELITAAFNK
jgi:AP-4 complex subunit beta-1